jgi:hypothetical protein
VAARIVWYALGGGLGHLNRALAVLRHLRPMVPDAGLLLLMSAPYVHLALEAGIPALRVPGAAEALTFPKGVTGLLAAAAIRELDPLDLLVVDTFADGLHLELTPEVLGVAARKVLIYREGGVVPAASPAWDLYDTILAPYPVSPHPDAEAVGIIVNRTPGEAYRPTEARRMLGLSEAAERPLVLAMHAGDPGEVLGFFAQVRAASAHLETPHDLRLVTPLPLPGEPWPEVVHLYPASEVLPAADLVLSGAGYNTHAELHLFGKRALFRPFDRSHDVQAARLDALDAVFGPLTDPVELAEKMKLALERPEPVAADQRDYEGANNVARALAAMVRP